MKTVITVNITKVIYVSFRCYDTTCHLQECYLSLLITKPITHYFTATFMAYYEKISPYTKTTRIWIVQHTCPEHPAIPPVSSFGFFLGPMACKAVKLASRWRSSSISARCICEMQFQALDKIRVPMTYEVLTAVKMSMLVFCIAHHADL